MEKPYNDRETMVRLYIKEGKSQKEIAEKFGVSDTTISRKVEEMGLIQPHKDPEVLRELHHEKRMSLSEMSDELNTPPNTIHYQMEKNGVEKRSRTEGRRLAAKKKPPTLTMDRGYETFVITDGEGNNVATVGHHRMLAIAEYGLEAVNGMDVHHINGIPFDNRPENLRLMTRSEHRSLHNKQRYE